MSGSDVSREDDEYDEGQFSDADDEAVEVSILYVPGFCCRTGCKHVCMTIQI